MKRLVPITLLAILTTFSLFAFMAYLITDDSSQRPVTTNYIPFDVIQTPEDSEVTEKQPVVLTPPKAPSAPPQMPIAKASTDSVSVVNIEIPTIGIDAPLSGNVLSGPKDKEARPVFRVTPKYPISAANNGIEGWVDLSFDINEIGQVENVKVVNAEPKKIFDRAAKRALKKWKYQAKVLNGKAVMQTGLSVRLDFNMNEQS